MSKLFGIGVGPGDSELITVKATKMINNLDILYTPIAHNGMKSTALRIATPYLNDLTEIKERHFPMTRNVQEREKSWHEITVCICPDFAGFAAFSGPPLYPKAQGTSTPSKEYLTALVVQIQQARHGNKFHSFLETRHDRTYTA